MEDLRIIQTSSIDLVADSLKYILLQNDVYRDFEGSINYNESQIWVLSFMKSKCIGFICYDEKNILYIYTLPIYREKRVLSRMWEYVKSGEYSVLANNNSKHFFETKGFEITKSYKKWHKMTNKK